MGIGPEHDPLDVGLLQVHSYLAAKELKPVVVDDQEPNVFMRIEEALVTRSGEPDKVLFLRAERSLDMQASPHLLLEPQIGA